MPPRKPPAGAPACCAAAPVTCGAADAAWLGATRAVAARSRNATPRATILRTAPLSRPRGPNAHRAPLFVAYRIASRERQPRKKIQIIAIGMAAPCLNISGRNSRNAGASVRGRKSPSPHGDRRSPSQLNTSRRRPRSAASSSPRASRRAGPRNIRSHTHMARPRRRSDCGTDDGAGRRNGGAACRCCDGDDPWDAAPWRPLPWRRPRPRPRPRQR